MKDKTNAVHCLGIDPGLANTGWAVISRHRSDLLDRQTQRIIQYKRSHF